MPRINIGLYRCTGKKKEWKNIQDVLLQCPADLMDVIKYVAEYHPSWQLIGYAKAKRKRGEK